MLLDPLLHMMFYIIIFLFSSSINTSLFLFKLYEKKHNFHILCFFIFMLSVDKIQFGLLSTITNFIN